MVASNDGPQITTLNLTTIENQTSAGTVVGYDPDTSDFLSYSLTGFDADDGLFAIEANTGVLSFNTAPDFENPADANADNAYEVDLQVSDGTVATTWTITVNVLDANEAPVITSIPLSANENETTPMQVIASDQDGDPLTFSMTGFGPDDELFSIDPSTGVLTFNVAPDFENPADDNSDGIYQVSVKASDGTFYRAITFYVTVQDTNDAPVVGTISLNQFENQTTVGTVSGSDQDVPANTLTWSISGAGADDGLFSIDANTGALSFNTAPDFENPGDANADNAYEVNVQVFDGTVATSKTINVNLLDANDAPVITSSNHDAPEGIQTPLQVQASDQDAGDILSYSIVGTADDDQLFTIDATSGVMGFIDVPDFENPGDFDGDNVYEVDVRVSDGTATTSIRQFVTVLDRNDTPQITFEPLSANENETTLMQVIASDQDGDPLIYSMTGFGPDDALFSIDSSTGVLAFNVAPDFENPADDNSDGIYQVSVKASDGTSYRAITLYVTVQDINDAPIIGTNSLNPFENQTNIGTVFASDQDVPANTLTWSITGFGADDGLFAIEANTGVLSFNLAPDFENPTDVNADNVYEVEVQVSDGTVATASTILVTVADDPFDIPLTLHWQGTEDSTWSNPNNWLEGIAPRDGDSLVFDTATTGFANRFTAVNDLTGLIVNAIEIVDNSSTANFTITGNAIGIENGISSQGIGYGAISFDSIDLNASQQWTNDGPLNVISPIQLGPHSLTFSGSHIASFYQTISGTGGFFFDNTWGATFLNWTQPNTYTGDTVVNAGTLWLFSSPGITTVAGNLIIGDGIGNDAVHLRRSDQIANTSTVTVSSSGTLRLDTANINDVYGVNETIATLVMAGGQVTTVGQDVGTLTVTNEIVSNASVNSSIISGRLSFGGGTTNLVVADGAASEDLFIPATIADGGFVKLGSGTLVLSGSNTYTGGNRG